jgi:hypothetical protein
MTELVQTYGEWESIPKIARQMQSEGVEISEQTVRRYIANYGQFFRDTLIDGVKCYPPKAAIPVLTRISEITRAGRRSREIITQLREEGFPEQESEPGPAEDHPFSFSASEVTAVLESINENLRRIALALEFRQE